MKKIFLLSLFCFSSSLLANGEDEAFFMQRIASFWKDREYRLLKSQAEEFLQKYPHSTYREQIYLLLADLYYEEKDWEKAAAFYSLIEAQSLEETILLKQSFSLFSAKKYQALIALLPGRLSKESENRDLLTYYYSQSLFQTAKEMQDERAKLERMQMAALHFEKLIKSKYVIEVLTALAEIYQNLGDTEKAVKTLDALQNLSPKQKERVLFQIALLQKDRQLDKALQAFDQIIAWGGLLKEEAAFNKLLLLFEAERFAEIMQEVKLFEKTAPTKGEKLLHFMLAKSAYMEKDYEKTREHFRAFLKEELEPSPRRKFAVMALLVSSYRLEDPEAVGAWAEIYAWENPDDPDLAIARYFHALSLKKNDHLVEALEKLEELIKAYPDSPVIGTFLFEYAKTFHEMKLWSKARLALMNYLERFPLAKHSVEAAGLFLDSTSFFLEKLKRDSFYEELLAKALADLNVIFLGEGKFPQEEKYYLLRAQYEYELSRFSAVERSLLVFLDKYPESKELASAHYLLALSYLELKNDFLFQRHAEESLKENPKHPFSFQLRMNLFNSYIESAKRATDPEEKSVQTQSAERYLDEVLELDPSIVKRASKFWLAERYFAELLSKGADKYLRESFPPVYEAKAKRTVDLFRLALSAKSISHLRAKQADPLLEEAIFHFAIALAWVKDFAQAKEVLQLLSEEQIFYRDLPWKLKNETLFALANVYLASNERKYAFLYYERLLKQSKQQAPFVFYAAKLELSRLELKELAREDFREGQRDFMRIANSLKELSLSRSIETEPIHLEAALDYITLLVTASPAERKIDKELFLLKRMQASFQSRETVLERDYHEKRMYQERQNRLYEDFMRLLEAKILYLEDFIQSSALKRERAEALLRDLEGSNSRFFRKELRRLYERFSS